MKVWLSPAGDSRNLSALAAARAPALRRAAADGARFAIVSCGEPLEACAWLLASFHSPVIAVPVSASLPEEALARLTRQLPEGSWRDVRTLSPEAPAEDLGAPKSLHEPWAVVFTSGSSGEPKGVALSGRNFRAAAFAHADHLRAHQVPWLLDLPLQHVGGLSVLTRSYFLGLPFGIGGTRFSPEAARSWARSGLVEGFSLVPTTLFRLLQEPGDEFAKARILLVGGAACDETLRDRALDRRWPVHLTYGMTEHASQIATERAPSEGLSPLPGVQLRLGAEGEVEVSSDCLADGAFVAGDLRPLPQRNGYFPTGDLGELRHGKLRLLGRSSELIKTGGVKVFPQEVEAELAALPGLRDCAVTALPDAEWGEKMCALLCPHEPAGFDPAAARAWLAARLDPRKLPKHWFVVPEIPRSAAGKPLRAEIRRIAAALYSQS